jgi:formylglycine-generating enzyme required for sulfatase activity
MSPTKCPLPILVLCLVVIWFGGWIGYSSRSYAAPILQQTPTQTPRPATAPSIGRLRFANNDSAATGSFVFQINSLPPPPTDSQYELWLQSEQGELLNLGALPAGTGRISFTEDTEQPLLARYSAALLSLEPTQDDDPGISTQIVLSGSLPAALLTPIRQLYFAGALNNKGLLAGAAEQVEIAANHAVFMQEALTQDDMAQARRHAEHIVNILVGENGLLYSDWDRDGQLQNPGDGHGLLVYLEEVQSYLSTVADSLAGAANASQLRAQIRRITTSTNRGHEQATSATEKALQIFAADTSDEAKTFADELAGILEQSKQSVRTAYNTGLDMAEIRLAPVAVVLAAPAATEPPTPTATESPAPTPTATESPTSTATESPTPEPAATEPAPTLVAMVTPTGVSAAAEDTAPTLTSTNIISPAITPAAQLTGALSDDGWVNPVDGGVYVYVPGGAFTMGASGAAAVAGQERPAHEVTVAGFWMQRTEVTNEQYGRCVAEGACTPPQRAGWDAPEQAEHPVNYVDWAQAQAYAAWAGGRLPSEAEWEKACRSEDGRTYPWGEQPPTAELANFNNNLGETLPVGSFPAGASPYGLLDLSGNVWEWTTSLERPYPYQADDGREDPDAEGHRIARGGSFYYTQYQLRCIARSGFAPTTANPHFGIRVVISPQDVTWVNPVDGGVYVYVPGGAFTMGASGAAAVAGQERPAHEVTVAGFWMQRTEVTNEQYGRCVAEGACTPPQRAGWDAPEQAEHPVNYVDWAQAQAYAAWAGGRLPSEAEWEKACRSEDGRTYPWGEQPPTAELANFNNNLGETLPVGSFPAGASPYGLLDLSGNVWEWTTSLERPYPYQADDGREDPDAEGHRIARGGSFYYTQYQLRCIARSGFAPTTANPHFGIRVVISTPESE